MDLKQLRYFVAVAEALNFTRAAERLHMAQPPLSEQIKALETELGTALLLRDTRRVMLTPAGQELLLRARQILDAAQQARLATQEAARGLLGRLALGYTASAMFTARLPAAIRQFAAQQPRLALDLQEMTSLDQLQALEDRRLDVGLLRRPDVQLPANVRVEPWYQAPLLAALPRGHALDEGTAPLPVAALQGQALITYPRDAGIGLYWPVMQLCARAGFRPRTVREAREPALMIGLVSAGVGVAIVPADTACIQLPGVAYRPLADAQAVSTLSLAFRVGEANGPQQALLALLRAHGDG